MVEHLAPPFDEVADHRFGNGPLAHLGDRVIAELHTNLPSCCVDRVSLTPVVAHRMSHYHTMKTLPSKSVRTVNPVEADNRSRTGSEHVNFS